jgi:hypothetical protein
MTMSIIIGIETTERQDLALSNQWEGGSMTKYPSTCLSGNCNRNYRHFEHYYSKQSIEFVNIMLYRLRSELFSRIIR